MFRSPFPSGRLVLAAAMVALAACSDGPTAPPVPSSTLSLEVDASAAYAYLQFQDTVLVPVSVADPATSTGWDLGLYATRVTLNGGHAGPGSTSGYCLCQFSSVSDAQLATLTASGTLATFDSVTVSAIPATSSFVTDQLDPAIADWSTSQAAGATPTAGQAWILRKGSGASVILGKFAVLQIAGATAANPGSVTFAYAVQPTPGAAFGTPDTVTVNTAGGKVYFDLGTGAVSTAAGWDLQFDGWNIRLNSGVSGAGTVMGLLDVSTAFASITAPYAATAPAQAFRTDVFSGVFAQNPWYRYNITGTDNQIWPTYNVYLVRSGTRVYKLQLTSYYSATGTSRHITIRYSRIAG